MTRTTVTVLIVVAVLLTVVALLIIRRRRYVQALRSRGWTFDSKPALETVLDHSAPPFGLGFSRSVDESISGVTRLGVPFHVFEYTCSDGGPAFDSRVASLRIPVALPPVFITDGTPRHGLDQVPVVEMDGAYQVRSVRPEITATVLSPAVLDAVRTFAQTAGRVDVSIDGDHLVAIGAPKDPEELEAYLESFSGVARAIDTAQLSAEAVPATPTGFGFFGRPDWVMVGQDDSLIGRYGLTTAGSHHRTEKVVRSPNDGLPMEAFVHRWQTTHTETSTDSEGRTTSRTVTDHHSENVMGVWMPFTLPALSINGGWGGQKVRFELEEFNDRFTVRTNSPKFASDVIHPQMMEFLLAAGAPDFGMEGQLIRYTPRTHDSLLIGHLADFPHEFLSRVPSFVWRDLGIDPPRFRTAFQR